MKKEAITTGTGFGIPETGTAETREYNEFDFARWGLNKSEHPLVSLFYRWNFWDQSCRMCSGKRRIHNPLCLNIQDGTMLEFATRGTNLRIMRLVSTTGASGNVFYGTEGYLELQAWETPGGEWQGFS